ncbi:MAG: hypothetical protein KDJ45_11145 [Hyphomicrobiaceae bacterium]|nr:hypothetical protein [Hyphomicrobiaceae bacterium]MCC0009443.1 hypothetical protein [Hyphomicrobiaceae bacterium]
MAVSTAAVLREADAAAAEAARDARAEVLEREGVNSEPKKQNSARKKKRIAKASQTSDGWHKFVVDVWITNFNSVEFGIYKHSRNRAKSRQFTKDMDVFAEIVENGERTGLLSYREDLWKEKEGTDKRLVVKLFSDKLNWQSTMDLMLARSLAQTFGARGLPVTTYSVNTSNDDYVVYIERSANKWPLLPEYFSFFLIDKDGNPDFYILRRDVINIGGDYTLYNQKSEVVGHLDGRILTLGGYWTGYVKEDLADRRLLNVMKMIAGMILFNGSCRRHMKRLYRDIRDGRVEASIERQETDLYMNPRRIR